MQATRSERKRESRDRILKAASVRLRALGLEGAAIGPVMEEAGLTHGAFSAHFRNKDELTREAFRYAISQMQPGWLAHQENSLRSRLIRMAGSYLSPAHRDRKPNGCPIAALASEVSSAKSRDFRKLYSDELLRTILEMAELDDPSQDPQAYDKAIACLALCIGGISLARNAMDTGLSDRILAACRGSIEKLA